MKAKTALEVVRDLLEQSGGDVPAALALAAVTIVNLAQTSSRGYLRSSPYSEPKPPPPVIDGPDIGAEDGE